MGGLSGERGIAVCYNLASSRELAELKGFSLLGGLLPRICILIFVQMVEFLNEDKYENGKAKATIFRRDS